MLPVGIEKIFKVISFLEYTSILDTQGIKPEDLLRP
jgi:hypothetical protein